MPQKRGKPGYAEILDAIRASGGAADPEAVAAVQYKKIHGTWPAEKKRPARKRRIEGLSVDDYLRVRRALRKKC